MLQRISTIGKWIDRKRIQIHLKNIEADLRRKDTADLGKRGLEKREKNIQRITEYRKRGEFPVNPDHLTREPYFIGPEGTACAVGYLMLQDGEKEMVEEIQEENNNVYLEDVGEGEIINWIEQSGLTKREAERIQPSYGPSYALYQSCGPVSCQIALMGIGILGAGAFLGAEWITWKYMQNFYPEKPLKRRGSLIGASVINAGIVATAAILALSLLP